ncbi:Heptaprenyl diphosphate synthase component 2 [termite gut metagenome]|uniref:Heptaprenyl diphosphate synthase component 2 n=1 Tax=termite gut metagenome TaxID=433724 RepID=A0A5J4SXH2_9ZZZZ
MDSLSVVQSPIIIELGEFKRLYDESLLSTNILLNEVITYLRQKNGKMMRPVLMLLTAKLYGNNTIRQKTFHAAISLELLHTASLLHDDVVDESFERRGQPSVNALYGNKVAVLVGDYLLATCLIQAEKVDNDAINNVILNLSKDLSEGELLQLSTSDNRSFSETVYFDIICKKTAALFRACTRSAALSVDVNESNIIRNATLLGEYIGICFQIRDDIFDYFDDKEVGKPTGNDMREGRLTLPVIYALNTVDNKRAKEIALKVRTGLVSSEEIDELTEFTKQHRGIEYAQQIMNDYKAKAFNLLSDFPDTDVRNALMAYIDYVVERKK